MSSPPHIPSSSVLINGLRIHLPLGLSISAFSLPPPKAACEVVLDVECQLLPSAIPASAVVDDLPGDQSVNYSLLSKAIYSTVTRGPGLSAEDDAAAWDSMEQLADGVLRLCVNKYGVSMHEVRLKVTRPKALLFSRSVTLRRSMSLIAGRRSATGSRDWTAWHRTYDTISIDRLAVETVLGLNPHERVEKQRVETDLKLRLPLRHQLVKDERWGFDYKTFGKVAQEYLLASSSKTIESLIHSLTLHLLKHIPVSPPRIYLPPSSTSIHSTDIERWSEWSKRDDIKLTVEIHKPNAVAFADSSSVRIKRRLHDYASSSAETEPTNSISDGRRRPSRPVRAWLAVGSNIGDRMGHIRRALNALVQAGDLRVLRTSGLYESKAMYVEDQADFLNGAIEVETQLSPLDLLLHLKSVERLLGRQKTMVNGPRVIDLDLLFYDVDGVMGQGSGVIKVGKEGDVEGTIGDDCGWLEVPHRGVPEREFVLRPLCDFADEDWRHPTLGKTISELLASLPHPPTLKPILPLHAPLESRILDPSRPLIMGILNVTPDSFSDGDQQRISPDSLEHVVNLAKQLVADGADIIDIGGMSTRPGVTTESVPEEEELSRVIPVIQALVLEDIRVPISIDTFRPLVAQQAVLAGAAIINDVRGGREPGMLQVMAKLEVPVILMHSRGDSVSMTGRELTDYSALGGVVDGVRAEMEQMVDEAEKAGVKRWNIIIDPGVGFAKSLKGNITLLRNLDKLVAPGTRLHGYPMLVGASRKGFIGAITGRMDPQQREFGNAAVTSMCCQSGVTHIIRVHEPGPAKDVISMWAA